MNDVAALLSRRVASRRAALLCTVNYYTKAELYAHPTRTTLQDTILLAIRFTRHVLSNIFDDYVLCVRSRVPRRLVVLTMLFTYDILYCRLVCCTLCPYCVLHCTAYLIINIRFQLRAPIGVLC